MALPNFPVDCDAALLTSIVNRNNIHLVGIDLNSRSFQSVVLDITHWQKAIEFAFQQRCTKGSSRNDQQTVHNCRLIDCHKDVWTRFPVFASEPPNHNILQPAAAEDPGFYD